jgi:NADH:ubiquinone oxidoreductase subunit H
VRVTVPRFKLETLSRLGWQVLLGLLAAVLVGLLIGYVWG